MSISRLQRISLTTANLEQAEAFYRDTLNFARVTETALDDPALLAAMAVPDATARSITLRLGAQELELLAFDPPGQPYPAASTAHDPWFQHIAIVVSDITAAWEKVKRADITLISEGGPQLLPPSTGSVTAVKFRDPEGHPLELIQFPPGTGDPAWQRHSPGTVFLGYDHSAIVTSDAAASARFYTSLLGASVMSRSINRGPEQERLDGTGGVEVDVVALQPAAETTPHIELLGYRTPPVGPAEPTGSVRDIAATRLVLQVDNLAATEALLRQSGIHFVSPGPVTLRNGHRAAMLLDPDGHRLLLIQDP